ncbi:telomerase reverse transcriptase [Aspergillus mulundensis]|uniref:Telomerase reverse transcriptase n=1 Tax=Aspergillus mulundensis TaxID=1810919 RepID=A0A3D8T648_9EURO|nr:hypothetical protein DSM5745_01322 [Aspergillus mulundensis]RDW94000.1 hypothetical protein DSM5745_01322 [Aspergillus mulundensis]
MGKKRKRPVKDNPTPREKPSLSQPAGNTARPSITDSNQVGDAVETCHPVISLYYRQVVTLRQYILQRIPRSSKARRRRIAAVGGEIAHNDADAAPKTQEKALADLLDTTLVGISKELPPTDSKSLQEDFKRFTQLVTQAGTDSGPESLQSDVVDFVISHIFEKHFHGKLEHVLSHGYRQGSGRLRCNVHNAGAWYPNRNVERLKQSPWTEVLALLGGNGDEIMIRLLLDCGLFAAVDAKKGIYYQLSGLALSSLKPIPTSPEGCSVSRDGSNLPAKSAPEQVSETRAHRKESKDSQYRLSPNAAVFCRQRMLYGRPHLNPKGRIVFGLPNHVLSRFPSSDSLQMTVHVMKYIFPQQFGLHNVFTVQPSYREHPLSKNYSSREEEIAAKEKLERTRDQRAPKLEAAAGEPQESIKIPKRLRGKALELVRQLQNKHRRCCYRELLRYYCSEELSDPWALGPLSVESEVSAGVIPCSASGPLITQPSLIRKDVRRVPRPGNSAPISYTSKRSGATKPKVNLTDHATPTASISAFCRAAIRSLIPLGFFGVGDQGISHQKIILGHVDRFIRMRRYESLSLHEVCEGIKITQIPWLEPSGLCQSLSENKISASDLQKRRELFHEFIYYLFDSILLPLIRGNFYVTESQVHRHRLFYFRHDVWRRLTVQPLANLRASMFEQLVPETAEQLLSGKKSLGYGSLRLLPKTTGIRPILNLKRRTLVKSTYAGKNHYNPAQSVNAAIAPVYSMLNYERGRRSDILGSSMFSVGDMHSRLKGFKESLVGKGWSQRRPLYFVKLDIQSCFDTIPQAKIVRLVEKLVSEENYHWMKYVEMRLASEFGNMWPLREAEQRKTWSKYLQRIGAFGKPEHMSDAINNGSVTGRRNTVFIDTIAQRDYSGEGLLDILNEHVQNNLVKIGKKYFRQSNGIPQGSVLSSLLCSLFYAEMERNVLGFLHTDDAILLRLLDDFLLITLDSKLAMDFLQVMVRGQPDYGISVNPAKSLVNFAASVDGAQIPRLVDSSLFPYCGSLINTRTLEISKDQDRMLDGAETAGAAISDSLSIDSMRNPGRSFHRKALASVKQSMHPMYLDSAHNSLPAVLLNLYKALVTAAMKMYRYTRSLPGRAQPRPEVVGHVSSAAVLGGGGVSVCVGAETDTVCGSAALAGRDAGGSAAGRRQRCFAGSGGVEGGPDV